MGKILANKNSVFPKLQVDWWIILYYLLFTVCFHIIAYGLQLPIPNFVYCIFTLHLHYYFLIQKSMPNCA